ncbi:dienelactone hydrolase family protein [Gemmatimonas sp.]|uniref:dienelactone hydrolase family protein n=1 Tax=Gemmatimonas sp. TaxID=1962908 RepID=UPI0025C2CE6E|nr:dienelactone hydrolase family protein [Gemmatimonas sp.]
MVRRLPFGLCLVALTGACTLQRSTPSAPAFARSSSTPGSLAARGASSDDHLAHMSAADQAAPAPAAAVGPQDLSLPPSSNGAAERVKNSPRHGEWVKIAYETGSADSLMAWVVYPFSKTASQKAPVVVVVHEIFGLSTWVRSVADQVAADGFIAVAPDFLSRVRGGPSTVELSADTARRLIQGVSTTERNTIIKAAANYAMMLPSAQPRYAVIGYCWGGTTTWAHGVNGGVKGYAGGVAFYGAPYTRGGSPATATTAAVPASVDADSLARISQPIMLLNGSKDARIAALMPAIDSVMKAQKKTYTGVNYDGAVHGFLRAQSDPRAANRDESEEAANLAATRDAWPRTVAFLRKQLGVK